MYGGADWLRFPGQCEGKQAQVTIISKENNKKRDCKQQHKPGT